MSFVEIRLVGEGSVLFQLQLLVNVCVCPRRVGSRELLLGCIRLVFFLIATPITLMKNLSYIPCGQDLASCYWALASLGVTGGAAGGALAEATLRQVRGLGVWQWCDGVMV
jgi:hypothetical protein